MSSVSCQQDPGGLPRRGCFHCDIMSGEVPMVFMKTRKRGGAKYKFHRKSCFREGMAGSNRIKDLSTYEEVPITHPRIKHGIDTPCKCEPTREKMKRLGIVLGKPKGTKNKKKPEPFVSAFKGKRTALDLMRDVYPEELIRRNGEDKAKYTNLKDKYGKE